MIQGYVRRSTLSMGSGLLLDGVPHSACMVPTKPGMESDEAGDGFSPGPMGSAGLRMESDRGQILAIRHPPAIPAQPDPTILSAHFRPILSPKNLPEKSIAGSMGRAAEEGDTCPHLMRTPVPLST